ncbi:MAG: hypothetical protein J6J60_04450 [Clostridia bacterium]|nr:hypothetical protein [Clostridia bacterium]
MKMLKEFGFIALFILVVVVIIGILFFEFIPTQVIEEPEQYKQAESTAKLISQIQEEQQPEEDGKKEEEVLQSYEVTKNQLYNSEQATDYVSGKAHPFYKYDAKVENSVTGDETNSSNTNTSNVAGNSNVSGSSTAQKGNSSTQSGNKNNIQSSNKNKIDTDNLVDKSNKVTTK